MDQWSLANPYGIQRDDAGDVWHAGHVNDVLQIDSDTIVVAADKGGVWRLTSAGDGTPLSHDWDNPDVLSLAFGPAGRQHIFAACGEYKGKGALWVTDPLAANPLAAWHKIPIPDAARGVTRVVVLPGVSRIVISAQQGLWWSALPSAANPFAYQWTQVITGLPPLAGDVWSEIAEGPDEGVVAAIPGRGLFFGNWVADALQMQPANSPGVNPVDFGRTSIASCAANRQIVYAVVEKGENLFAVLSSGDGGRTWQILATQVIGLPPGTTVPAEAGDQGSYNNCIAVSPENPAIVAIGWRVGLFLSQDSGATWQKYDVVNQPPQSPFHP